MSLNGLDDPQVAAAYETAAAEPGAWYACPLENSLQKL